MRGTKNLAMASYATRRCAKCGKMFECSRSTRYRIENSVYCSYGCFREHDAPRREEDRKRFQSSIEAYERMLFRKKERGMKQMIEQEKKLVSRVAFCDEKVSIYTKTYNMAKKGSTTKRKALDSRREWTRKLTAAQDELIALRAEIEKMNNVH